MKYGDIGKTFYILLDGICDIYIPEEQKVIVKEGQPTPQKKLHERLVSFTLAQYYHFIYHNTKYLNYIRPTGEDP